MSDKVRFVSSVPALTYDPNVGTVQVVISVDDKGRRWKSTDGYPDVLMDSPDEPTPQLP